MGRKRSNYTQVTNEHRAFKQMLEDRKSNNPRFSYRFAGRLLNKSDSYISQLANGRADFPKGKELDHLLATLFGIKTKSFRERVRLYKERMTPQKELGEAVSRLDDQKSRLVIKFIQSLAT